MKKTTMAVLAVMFAAGMLITDGAIAQAKGKGKKQGKGVQTSTGQQGKGAGKADRQSPQMHRQAHEHKHQQGMQSSTPYGWSQGRKTGWDGGNYPPGWSKWNRKKKNEWREHRVRSIQDIDVLLVRHKFPERQSSEIIGAFDQAIAGGMAIDDARTKIVRGLNQRATRRSLMVDAGQQALELLR